MSEPTLKNIESYVRARFPVLGISTAEEARVISGLVTTFTTGYYKSARFFVWDLASGLTELKNDGMNWTAQTVPASELGPGNEIPGDEIASLYLLFQAVTEIPFDPKDKNQALMLFFIKDAHGLLNKETTDGMRDRRMLRNIIGRITTMKRCLIFISPEFVVPAELNKEIVAIDYPLPTRDELMAMLMTEANRPAIADRVKVSLDDGAADRIVDAMTGLTYTEAYNALYYAIVSKGELTDIIIPVILTQKEQIVKQSKLEYYHPDVTDQDVGGLDLLKGYVKVVRSAFTQEARNAGVPRPRGTIVVGPPGTGKSLMAKVVGGGVMPILRMDLANMLGKYYGDSEGALRQALKIAEAVAPCVLWLDEIEKAIGSGSAGVDGREVEQRMLAQLLTWMQESTAPVYIFATSNDVRGLNEALISRFDEVFSAVLPDEDERAEIFGIHLRRNNLDPDMFDLAALAHATPLFAGREIVKSVTKALLLAYNAGEPVSTEWVLQAARTVKPVAAMRADDIQAIITWGETWATPASTPKSRQDLVIQAAARKTVKTAGTIGITPDGPDLD